MEELNTPIFAQAKVEYTAQLIDILYPHMFDGVKSIYDESKLLYSSKKIPILLIFRELLEKVPIWNSEIIESECSRITNNSNCDYIDDLITAVFISHTKILTSIGPNQSFNKINVTIPKCTTFIHKSYINTARELWKNPYLFNESVPGHEFQKNNKEIENIIKTCIENTIRNLLPIKEILKEHLEGETDSILNQKETLKQLLREELSELKSNSVLEKEHTISDSDTQAEEVDIVVGKVAEAEAEEAAEAEAEEAAEAAVEVAEAAADELMKEGPVIINEDTEPNIVKEEEKLTDLENKLTQMVEKMESEPLSQIEEIVNNEPTEEPSMSELFPSSNDPSEEQVSKQCSDIVVNDITVPVEIPGQTPVTQGSVVEIKYDNVDINSSPVEQGSEDKERLKRLMTNMEVKEEINVVKSNEIATTPIPQPEPEPQTQPTFSLNSLYPNMNNTTSHDNPKVDIVLNDTQIQPLQLTKEDKPITDNNTLIPTIQEPKSPRKEMVAVKNEDDIDETSSLANFFDDMKQIVEDKGIKVEKNNDKMFTLFEDANEVEKM
jgi:hypothetical protein